MIFDENFENCLYIFLLLVLPFRDITGLELEVKGECIPLNVVLHPYAMFVSAPTLIGSTVKRLFTVSQQNGDICHFRFSKFFVAFRRCILVGGLNVYISHYFKYIGTLKTVGGWRWRTG